MYARVDYDLHKYWPSFATQHLTTQFMSQNVFKNNTDRTESIRQIEF
jgi:hypothetical protein